MPVHSAYSEQFAVCSGMRDLFLQAVSSHSLLRGWLAEAISAQIISPTLDLSMRIACLRHSGQSQASGSSSDVDLAVALLL